MAFISSYLNFLPYCFIIITATLIIGLFKPLGLFLKNDSGVKSKYVVRFAVIFVLILYLGALVMEVGGTYYLWKQGSPAKFLLPPYQSIRYFIGYVGYRFVVPILSVILVGALFFFVSKIIDHIFQNRIFYLEEHWLIFYGIIIVGHPLWIFYLFAMLVFGVVTYLLGIIFHGLKFGEFFSLRYLWLPLALLILLFQNWLIKFPFFYSLKF